MSKQQEIAEIFDTIADSLEILEENRFKIRAYRNAARNILEIDENIEELNEKGDLSAIPGVGKDLGLKIQEYLSSGKIRYYEDLKKKVPPTLIRLLSIQSLGPKTLSMLHREFDVSNLSELQSTLEKEELRKIKGMGQKKIDDIKKGIELLLKKGDRINIGIALPTAHEIIKYISGIPGTGNTVYAGSLRRMKETIGDLDILTISDSGREVIDSFVKLPIVREVLASGETKGSIITENDIQVDLRVVKRESYGAALQYFTGSQAHNVKLRTMAVKKGLSINEYGIFKGSKCLASKTEEEIYNTLGLPYFEPELREDRGEFEAAASGSLPDLIELDDIRGDLHTHSKWSDGRNTIEEMANAAKKMGYDYIAITDHSPASRIANGLSIEKLKEKNRELEKIRDKVSGIEILMGTEVDILSDGTLDYPDRILKDMDIVIASVHSGFKSDTEKMTKRILKAIKNPYVHILGHPTGRLINEREPYNADLDEIYKTAFKHGKALEINSSFMRLDLKDLHARKAKNMGIKLTINTDAHHINQLSFIKYGIGTARRGWIEKDDVINCMEFRKLKNWLNDVSKTSTD